MARRGPIAYVYDHDPSMARDHYFRTHSSTLKQMTVTFVRACTPAAMACLLISGCSSAPEPQKIGTRPSVRDVGSPLPPHIYVPEHLELAFVETDSAGSVSRLVGGQLASTPLPPASTFKIFHAVVALETGTAQGLEEKIAWDPERDPARPWWPATWSGDHDLESAIRNSVVWYFQEMARRIGQPSMTAWLERLDYGNAIAGPGVDDFWLEGDLRITAHEQVDALRRLDQGRLPISARTRDLVRQTLLLREEPDRCLYGKSGTVELDGYEQVGWFVGFSEESPTTRYFALVLRGTDVFDIFPPDARRRLATELLGDSHAGDAPGQRLNGCRRSVDPD